MTNTEEAKGEITLTKTGKDNAKLAGAEFDLYRVKQTTERADVKINNAALVTDETGEIYVNNLDPGTYYFVETKAPAGYETPTGIAAKTETRVVKAGQTSLDPLTVTMTNTEKTTNVTVNKQWLNGDGTKTWPTDVKVTIQLTADGYEVDGKTAELSAAQPSFTFEKLPKYKVVDGQEKEIKYSVNELSVDHYESNVGAIDDQGVITVTNKFVANGNTNLDGTKVLSGRPFKTGDQWTFTVTSQPATAPQPERKQVTIDAVQNAAFDFGKINFTQDDIGKTYTYTITETGTVTNVTNDAAKEVTVKVEYDATTKGLKITNSADEKPVIFKNKYIAEAETTIDGSKKLVGRQFKNGDTWTFTLTSRDADAPMPADSTITMDAAEDATFSFGPIKYTQDDIDKTYTYTIEETGNVKNVTNDAAKEVTVKVEYDESTKGLKITNSSKDSNVVFTNTYSADGTTVINGTKVLSGREFVEGDKWTFQLSGSVGAPMPKDQEGNNVTEVTIDASKNVAFAFPAIKYTQDDIGKTYTYTVKESGTVPNVTNDKAAKTVTVSVEYDEREKALVVTNSINENPLVFTNTYEAEITTDLEATKELQGREVKEGDIWTFEVTAEKGTPMPEKTSVELDLTKGNKAKFGSVKYTQADIGKTYTYTISEIGQIGNVTNDTAKTVTVKVGFDKETGKLTVENSSVGTPVKFVNVYKATAETTLSGTKRLAGREFQEGDKWTFEVTMDPQGAPKPEKTKVEVDASKSADIDFGKIAFTEKDIDKTYTYTITETGKVASVKNDTAKTVTVKVEYDAATKGLKITNSTTDTPLVFTNTYSAAGEETYGGKKVLEGRNFQKGDKWFFEIAPQDGAPAPVANGAPVTVVTIEPTQGNETEFSLGTFKYTLADLGGATSKTFVYKITESGTVKGVKNDTDVDRLLKVTVTDQKDGTLDVKLADNSDDVTFTNTYEANGNVQLSAYKVLKGRTLEAGQFTFVLKDSKGATIDTKTNDANGNVVFKTIAYTQEDVKNSPFTYTIEETPGTNTAYTYAENKETITVTVVDDGKGTITATPDKTGMAVKFTNTYTANGKVTLSAKKKLKGKTLEAGEFTFKLKDSEGNVLDTKTNAADGTVEFAEIAYTQADVDATTHKGTKTYTISEVNEGKDGYTYDKDVETITVTLKDDGNGTITATPDKNGAEVLFENEYKADGKVKLKAVKTTEGHLLANEQYTFQLKDADGVIETKKNAADGSVVFSEITYDQTDLDANGEATFVYTILEVNDRQKGWTYPSPLSKTITVTLKDQGNGKIKVTADPADFTVTFKNTYTAAGNVKLDAKKVLKGGELKAEQFTFELKEGNTVLQTVKNDKDGNISFAAIPYTQADITDKANGTGSKTYTISEVAGQETGYTYDSSVLTVNVSLEDNDDGTITATADKKLGDLTFTNRYSETHFSKTDMGGEEIEGAKITILKGNEVAKDGNGNEISWISGSDGKTGDKLNDHVVYGLADGVYTMHEVSQPDGYTLAVDIEFEIKDGYVVKVDGKDVNSKTERKVTMIDELTKVNISKTDVTDKDNKEIGGAHIQIIENGKVIEEWDSVDGKTHTVEGLKAGVEYILRETVAPNGYTVTADSTFTIDDHGKVTATTKVVDKNGEQVVLVQDTKTEVKVSKTDIASGDELEGATIQIIDKDGKVVEEWTSKKDDEKTEDVNEAVHVVQGLKTGEEYTLKETVAPDGYTIAAETKFTIDEKGKVTSTGTVTEGGVMLVEDKLTEVHVSKVDVADGDELEGATIQIIDKDGKVVEEWTSVKDDETTTGVNEAVHVVQGLKTGEEYTLKETVAPNGYTIAAETKFTIDENGKVTSTGTVTEDDVMLVEDALSEVHVSKTDVASGEELEGATIQILDKDGKVVESWISGQDGRDKDGKIKDHVVKGLTTGVEYTLKETVAPDGYTIAAETKFTIDEKGKVTSTGTVTEGGVVLVEDALTSVTISKVDVANGEEVEGAHIQILDKDGNVVEEWTSEKNGGHEVKGLKTGEAYTLKETVAPNGYDITTETTFVLDENGKVDTTKTTTTVSEEGVLLVEDDRTTEVPVEKRLRSATGEEQILPNAQLRVVRVNADGSETDVESWTSGDAAHAVVDSTNNDPTNTNLKAGTYILYEDATPNDEYFQIADPITFTVDGLGVIRVNGEVVDSVVMLDLLTESGENWYESEKNKSNTDVDTDEENTEDDTEKEKESKKKKSTTTTTKTNTRTTSTTSTPTRSSGAKTADNTNAALPLAGGSVAMLAILYLLLEEKKRRQAK